MHSPQTTNARDISRKVLQPAVGGSNAILCESALGKQTGFCTRTTKVKNNVAWIVWELRFGKLQEFGSA
eukprot:6220254-Amphidinium_carterae.1